MEYWEVTKQRAQETLPVWNQYLPTFTLGGKTPADLTDLIDAYEPLMQARTDAQDTYDAGYRLGQDSLLRMKSLGTKIPAIIEAQLSENEGIMKDLDDLYRNPARAEGSILKRLRDLLPIWARANAAMAASVPPQAPITRLVGGIVYTVATAKALLDGYTDVMKQLKDKEELLDRKRSELRAHDRTTDQLIKRWYKAVKASHEPGTEIYEALGGITTEPSTPVPEVIEIQTVVQGGEEGLQALVSYLPGGGAHATTKLVKYQVVGVDTDFAHSLPLDASGNALGPFCRRSDDQDPNRGHQQRRHPNHRAQDHPDRGSDWVTRTRTFQRSFGTGVSERESAPHGSGIHRALDVAFRKPKRLSCQSP